MRNHTLRAIVNNSLIHISQKEKWQVQTRLRPRSHGTGPYGHHINFKSLKTSMPLKFVVILQNLIKAYHRKSGKSKYDRTRCRDHTDPVPCERGLSASLLLCNYFLRLMLPCKASARDLPARRALCSRGKTFYTHI